jgi:hypothetical protein
MAKSSTGHGRGVSGKRGLGSGSDSHKTSTGKPAKLSGYKKTGGDGMGSKATPYKGGKDRMTGKKY